MRVTMLLLVAAIAIGCGGKKGGDMTAEEYEKRNTALGEKVAAMFKSIADEKDCDKAAGVVNKFIDENKDEDDLMTAYHKEHAGAKQEFDRKHKELVDNMMGSVKSVFANCKSSKAMQDAIGRMKDD